MILAADEQAANLQWEAVCGHSTVCATNCLVVLNLGAHTVSIGYLVNRLSWYHAYCLQTKIEFPFVSSILSWVLLHLATGAHMHGNRAISRQSGPDILA